MLSMNYIWATQQSITSEHNNEQIPVQRGKETSMKTEDLQNYDDDAWLKISKFTDKPGPPVAADSRKIISNSHSNDMTQSKILNVLWLVTRTFREGNGQEIPAWRGFNALIQQQNVEKSLIRYHSSTLLQVMYLISKIPPSVWWRHIRRYVHVMESHF